MNFIRKNKQKKLAAVVVACFFAVTFFFFSTPSAQAWSISGMVDTSIKGLIYSVFVVFGWLLTLSGIIMGWVCDVNNVQFFMNNEAVLAIWHLVRDFANMFFILVLLFSAFCTIFQVTKWGIKNIWLNVLINALLVNFSYSIARFLIDISNVIMYYFLNNAFGATTSNGAGGIFANISTNSNITKILVPEKVTDYEVSFLITATIFVFVLAMTLLVVAGMFVVRLIRLTILVMFSPVGFVGYIFPKFNKYADDWWSDLFKYAFMGPIMLFAIMVAMKMMEVMSKQSATAGFAKEASKSVPKGFDPGFLAALAFYMIPIFILWIGVSIAASMSSEVKQWAGKVGGWGKKFQGAVQRLPGKGWRATGIPGGISKGFGEARKSGKLFGSEKLGKLVKDNSQEKQDIMAARIEGGRAGVEKYKDNKKAAKNKEDIKKQIDDHDRTGTDTLRGGIATIAGNPAASKEDLIKGAAMVRNMQGRRDGDKEMETKWKKEYEARNAKPNKSHGSPPLPMRQEPGRTPFTGVEPTLSPTATDNERAVYAAKHAEYMKEKENHEQNFKEEHAKWEKEKENLRKEWEKQNERDLKEWENGMKEDIQKQRKEWNDSMRDLLKRAEEA